MIGKMRKTVKMFSRYSFLRTMKRKVKQRKYLS